MIVLLWLGCAAREAPLASVMAGEACATRPLPVTWSSYAVEGGSREALAASIAANGPGVGRVGVTRAEVDWACSRVGADVDMRADVGIVVVLPAWSPPPGADPALVASWERFMAVQRAHEQHHVDIAASWLSCVEEAAAAEPTCAAAGERVGDVMDAMQREQDAYDRRTRHGVREGSVL